MADRVVFVSHEASRTGAPISLLVLLRWLRAHTDLELEVIVLERGVDDGLLLDTLAAVAPTHLCADPRRWARVIGEADVLYLNSVFAAPCLSVIGAARPHVIARVPELSMSFRHWLTPEDRGLLLGRTNRFVAVSDAVRRMLVSEQGVEEERIVVIPGTVEAPGGRSAPGSSTVRAGLGIAADAHVVGCVGTTEWRKGPDLFVRMARGLGERSARRPHAVWVGSPPGGPPFWSAERAHGVDAEGRIHFVASVDDPTPYYETMDVLALTSREDPFPRVCVEAAARGVPFVTFDSGGAPELARAGCGEVVDYLDVDAMVARVHGLLDDPDRRRALGRVGSEVVRERYTIDTAGPAVLTEIERGLAAR